MRSPTTNERDKRMNGHHDSGITTPPYSQNDEGGPSKKAKITHPERKRKSSQGESTTIRKKRHIFNSINSANIILMTIDTNRRPREW